MLKAASPLGWVESNGTAICGAWAGELGRSDVRELSDSRAMSRVWRLCHHKRWLWTTIITSDVTLAIALVDLGYAGSAFAFVVDHKTGKSMADQSWMTLPLAVRIDSHCGEGSSFGFRALGMHATVRRAARSSLYEVIVKSPRLAVQATLDTSTAPPAMSAVGPVPGGVVCATQKQVGLGANGTVRVGDRKFSLQDSVAGIDYSQGLLARRTKWHWAFGMGHDRSDRRIALNLVEGFNGQRECVVWVGQDLFAMQEAVFEVPDDPFCKRWRITTPDGVVSLDFHPLDGHRERLNARVVRSDFVQPAGTFSGAIHLPGRQQLLFDNVPGVAESQDITW